MEVNSVVWKSIYFHGSQFTSMEVAGSMFFHDGYNLSRRLQHPSLAQNNLAGRFQFSFQRVLQELRQATQLALSPPIVVYCMMTRVKLLHIT